MRVLMLSWEYPPLVHGGLGRHVEALAASVAGLGHEVTVVAPGPPPSAAPTGDDWAEPVAPARVRVRVLHPDPADPVVALGVGDLHGHVATLGMALALLVFWLLTPDGWALLLCIFFSEHICQIMWVRGPSMTPCLNEDYDVMHTKSDMVLVNMWPVGGAGWPWQRQRRLERGMVVTFRWVLLYSTFTPLT